MNPLNKEKLELLASTIEKQKHNTGNDGVNPRDAVEGFTMVCVQHTCGTPACIAGYAYSLAVASVDDEAKDYIEHNRNWYNVASSWLNDTLEPDGYTRVAYNVLTNLFEPRTHTIRTDDWYDITPAQAAKVIRHLADTGEVDWSIIEEEVAATE